MSSLFGSLDTTKLDKVDVVDPSTATEDGKAADAKSTYKELTRISGMASDAKELAESKADQFALEAHVASTNNPHSVTAEQVNAYTKETVDAKLDEKADIVGGKIPAAQLPSYVDDVLEYDTMSDFPETGEGGKIYVAKDTNLTYRWRGMQHVEISPSPLLDDTVTEKSPNGVKSSGIWSWVKSLLPKWLTSDYAEPATAASVEAKADKATTLAGYGITDAVPLVEDSYGNKTAVTIGNRIGTVGPFSIANGNDVTASEFYSHAEGSETVAAGATSHAEGLLTIANGQSSHAEGWNTAAYGSYSHTEGCYSKTRTDDDYAFVWNGDDTKTVESPYTSNGEGTFNINPVGGLAGFYIGEQTIAEVINVATDGKLSKSDVVAPSANSRDGQAADAKVVRAELDSILRLADKASTDATTALYDIGETKAALNNVKITANDALWASERLENNKADKSDISAENPTFSNAVLTVGLNIDTNSVAVLNEIAATFGGFPIEGMATTVGGLLAALAAAITWLKKNKVGSFASVGGASATVENGVAKLDDFFTASNSLLNGRLAYSRNETGLKDRAFNALTFDGTEYNLSTALAAVTPTASGQPRDLLIVATATAATTISFTAGTIKGDKPTIDGSGTWLITLTEYASGVWYCRQIKMEDAA